MSHLLYLMFRCDGDVMESLFTETLSRFCCVSSRKWEIWAWIQEHSEDGRQDWLGWLPLFSCETKETCMRSALFPAGAHAAWSDPHYATARDWSLTATPASPCPRPDGLLPSGPAEEGDQMMNPRAPKLCNKQPNGRRSVAPDSRQRACVEIRIVKYNDSVAFNKMHVFYMEVRIHCKSRA